MDSNTEDVTPPRQPEQLTLFYVGDEAVATGSIPSNEVAWILRFKARGVSDVFWDHYRTLRSEGYIIRHAFAGAWMASGRRGRGSATTILALADVLEVTRKTVHDWLAKEGALHRRAQELRAEFWADRVPDVDAQLYARVTGLEATTADFKLAYQRARVPLSGEDADPQDGWLQAVERARTDNGNQD